MQLFSVFKIISRFFLALKKLIIGPTPFFHSPAQTTAHSAELIFHIMKSRDQTSVLLSVCDYDFGSRAFLLSTSLFLLSTSTFLQSTPVTNSEATPEKLQNATNSVFKSAIFLHCQAFRVFDKDGSGYVSGSELKLVMSRLGVEFSDDELEEMVNTLVHRLECMHVY